MWEVIEALEMYEVPIVSLTSDGAKANRRFYQICAKDYVKKISRAEGNVPYKTSNPYGSVAELYFFCDVPHLLKTARNCFSNSFAHSHSRKMQVSHCQYARSGLDLYYFKRNGQDISWKWIEHLYLSENTFGTRVCHKLTKDHIWLNSFTRMRVYLAAQVRGLLYYLIMV